jgi:hypothetical protein
MPSCSRSQPTCDGCPADFDGDGFGDLAVGASSDVDGGEDRGAVWILFLNANGTVKPHQKISDTQGGFTGGKWATRPAVRQGPPSSKQEWFSHAAGRSWAGIAERCGDGTLKIGPLVTSSRHTPSPCPLASQSVLDDASHSACRAVGGAVEALIRLANPDGMSAYEFNLYVTSLIRAAARPIEVREAYDNEADPLKDAG